MTVGAIEDVVPWAHEGVTKDGHIVVGGLESKGSCGGAAGNSVLAGVERERESSSSYLGQGEDDIGEGGNDGGEDGTADGTVSSEKVGTHAGILECSGHFVVHGSRDVREGGSGIEDGKRGHGGGQSRRTNGDRIDVHHVVGLGSDGRIAHRASLVGGVDASHNEVATSVGQTDGEDVWHSGANQSINHRRLTSIEAIIGHSPKTVHIGTGTLLCEPLRLQVRDSNGRSRRITSNRQCVHRHRAVDLSTISIGSRHDTSALLAHITAARAGLVRAVALVVARRVRAIIVVLNLQCWSVVVEGVSGWRNA